MSTASSADARTVRGILRLGARGCPDRPAIVSRAGVAVTYHDLLGRGTRRGRALLDLGLQPGDRVAAWMEDSTEYIELYVACALAGLVVVPINARYTEHEARPIIEDAGSRVLVFSDGVAARAGTVTAALPGVVGVGTSPSPASQRLFGELLSTSAEPLPDLAPDQPFIIGYTSGTTGPPKGAMLTQGSVATLARMNAHAYRLPIASVAALTGSMSFVAVVPAHIFSHFYVRGTVHVLGAWDVESLLSVVERHRVTFTYIPSPLLDEFAAAAAKDPARWQSLESVLHSGSKVPVEKLRALADVVGHRLVEGLGMTENSGGLVTATTPADVLSGRGPTDPLRTVGRAVPEVEIQVVDETGTALPHDGTTIGELIFSSPALMAGYWGRPIETADALREGWYHSGDLGTIDPDGYIEIYERRSDLIVSGGMNVYPYEVEACIARLPGVADCVVVGLPHERWGQSVAAAVVPTPGSDLDETAVVAHCVKYLASYKKPTRVVFVQDLPTTTSLKVSRQSVRDLLMS